MLTGKKANNGWTVSFSHIRNKKLQGVNLQYKRVYWPEKQRYVRLRISTKAMKSINKLGLEAMAKRAGLDLESLAYSDASSERKEWLHLRLFPLGDVNRLRRRAAAEEQARAQGPEAGLRPQVERGADEEEGHERRGGDQEVRRALEHDRRVGT